MKEILSRLVKNEVLSTAEAKDIFLNISKQEYTNTQLASLLSFIQMRYATVDEIIGFREALLELSVPINLSPYEVIDIVGTGGDGKNTFNISTCACFVLAGAGYKVAKHGNYGATSVSGASNVIEQHGVKFTNKNDNLLKSIEESNMAYLHAQLFHPVMKLVGPIRKELQIPTVFNLLGPLINPTKPKYQLLGVDNLDNMRLYDSVNSRLGIEYCIVNSLDGYDEISLTHEFKVTTKNGEHVYLPQDIGLTTSKDNELTGGKTLAEATRIFDDVLENKSTLSQKSTVLANAAFAIQIIESQKSLEECLSIAKESLESGRALKALKKFISINQE